MTKKFLQAIKQKLEEQKEAWASGFFAAPSLDEMAIRNACAQGYSSALKEILEMNEDELEVGNE